MRKKYVLLGLGTVVLAAIIITVMNRHAFVVLQPKGQIADRQRDLILFATILSCFIVLPVLAMTFGIAWKYRQKNTKARYTPDWDHSRILETIWWTLPCLIILALAVVTWNSSHSLDPARPIIATGKPMIIQVVALRWKWLFLYPEQGIATVNYVQFPASRPVRFEITADAPMNSFWIPALGGQIYAMPGMQTQLNLAADKPGAFQGSSANLSGKGFSGMHFMAQATTDPYFDIWVKSVRRNAKLLNANSYQRLAQPSENVSAIFYAAADPNLYANIIGKYMAHDMSTDNTAPAGLLQPKRFNAGSIN